MAIPNTTEKTDFLDLCAVNNAAQILSDETTKIVSTVLLYGVSPVISVVGVTFNVFSIIVLFKHGIHKCSNILLISLAFMDISFLIGYTNIPLLIYSMYGGERFLFSKPASFLLYVLYFVGMVMDYAGSMAALSIPMLITVERLVAVYIPMKFGQIITPLRTWVAVGGTILFWVATMTYTCFWHKFEYVFDDKLNRSVGLISNSRIFYNDFDSIQIFEEFILSLKVPPLVTVFGCVAIIIKVRMASRKRSIMTSSKVAKTSKTTQTLLTVCVAYLLICAFVAIPGYLPKHLSAYKLTPVTWLSSSIKS